MVYKWNLVDIFHQFYNDVEESIDSAKSAEITKNIPGSDQMKKAQKKLTLSKIDFLSSVIIIGLD